MESVVIEIEVQKYEAYKSSEVEWLGEIPGHWLLLPGSRIINERCEKNKGMVEKTVLSLSYGKVVIKPEEKLVGLVPESFETYQLVYPGDIIIRPTDLQNDKTSLRVGLAKNKGIITNAYINLKVNASYLNRYYHYFLYALDITKIIYSLGSGLRQNLSYEDFKRLKFLAPPLEEQTAIANFLDRKTAQIDQAIAQKERLIELLQERRQILIQRAVTRGLNPDVPMKDSGVDWIGEVPAHWEVTQIKKVAKSLSGGTPPSGEREKYYGGLMPWIRTTDLNDSELCSVPEAITQAALRDTACKEIQSEFVCVAMYGGAGTIGKHSLVRFASAVNQAVCALIPSPRLLVDYLFFYVKFCRPYWMIVAKGSRVDPNIGQDDIKNFPIVVPSIDEQEEVVAYLNLLALKTTQSISKVNKQIEQLREYKSTLINAAVTGKIKVC
ncbi:restriction endonuclease subunit S [Hymenobacter sp. 15J16-1T3B]|uniref:restriction endonuclease subunit S n=1 Tax=Hymenobacter sp. 15J16-1T3B TaxID=2886941 RepID=UPI001D1102B3|nr:restriction endonuclease subunit S [Hymenobacter sp. 15J16-1T3B]MCC3160848.1 restriction endonuclease subunit S [Hymenobacter sp. 15J16-1T3B]